MCDKTMVFVYKHADTAYYHALQDFITHWLWHSADQNHKTGQMG